MHCRCVSARAGTVTCACRVPAVSPWRSWPWSTAHRSFNRSGALQTKVGETLDRIGGEGQELAQHEREDQQAEEIAQLYKHSISKMSPRIVVSGKPQYLQSERTTNWIRTLLLAGIRSATLWNQLGGGRFELMFARKKILKDVEQYLMG